MGCKNKLQVLLRICNDYNIALENVCYVGDDINDLEALQAVGYGCCPADAVPEVKRVAQYITHTKGGNGVIREIVNKIIREQNQ